MSDIFALTRREIQFLLKPMRDRIEAQAHFEMRLAGFDPKDAKQKAPSNKVTEEAKAAFRKRMEAAGLKPKG